MSDFALAAGLAVALLAVLAAAGRLRFVIEELPTPARRLVGGLLLWAVLTTCVFLPIVAPGAAAEVDPATLSLPDLFLGQLVLVTFLVGWWVLAQPLTVRRFLFLEDGSIDDVVFGLRIGVISWGLALIASAAMTLVLYLVAYDPTAAHAGSSAAPFDVPELLFWLVDLPVWQKLIVVAVAMTTEEAFYRAFLQTRFGWVPSSILFALSHAGYGMPTLMASVFAVSLAIGWALRRRGSLIPCIVAHGVFDAVQLLVVMPLVIDELRP
jgi:membrane protease YdiL (CAAX protease family)